MSEEELRVDLAAVLGLEPHELAEVGVEEPHGEAWAATVDGRRYGLSVDRVITAYEFLGSRR